MIHETGIYIFESKNYSGAIYGSAEQKEWTQVLEFRGKRHFYNPIWQNRGHISALKRVLGQELNYYSYVVFSERCSLRDVPVDSETSFILRRHHLQESLVKMMTVTQATLSVTQVEALYQQLQKSKKIVIEIS
ncbi:NERD domain-containing protein [Candidatus Saccharibacteria bacterium]|nr:NERD domain-containing protein [Candidatus Saccharibacteria bacterium]